MEWKQEEDNDDDEMHATEALDSDHYHHQGSDFRTPARSSVAPDRRSISGSSTSNGPAPSSISSHQSSRGSSREAAAPAPLPSPPNGRSPSSRDFQSGSSAVSSPRHNASASGGWSPLHRRTLSQSPAAAADSGANSTRHELARRLTLLVQRLACGDEVDEMALSGQLEQMEKVVRSASSPSPNPRRQQLPRCSSCGQAGQQQAPPSSPSPRSLLSRSRSEAGSVFGSPVSLIRSQFSDLSLASFRERERERERECIEEDERARRERPGIPEAQANQLIAESNKLNEELSRVAENLKARQEEMDHINKLLVERTERAAERIVFLQDRILRLEHELSENDDELQHLRICLKAVEIQMPPNPDTELQRCINVFKDDFRRLQRKRAHRATVAGDGGGSITAVSSPRTPVPASAPTTPGAGVKRLSSKTYGPYT